jgi:hypothetical protein
MLIEPKNTGPCLNGRPTIILQAGVANIIRLSQRIYKKEFRVKLMKFTFLLHRFLVCLSIYLRLYSPCGPWPLFQFLNLYTAGRTPWTGHQPVARPLPTYRTTQYRINAHGHPCLEWDSNTRSQCSSGRGRFMH